MDETKFAFDIFLSHSSKDKDTVREMANQLRADGLRVWFDEWVLKPGDSIPAKIEEGLERSRVLVLCMSANAFGSDWAQLEAGTFRFRDPLNRELRFIPLRLDDAPIKGSLAQFLYINWFPTQEGREQEYAKLLEACRPEEKVLPAATSGTKKNRQPSTKPNPFNLENTFGHSNPITRLAWSPAGISLAFGSTDGSVFVWDVVDSSPPKLVMQHGDWVECLAWSRDGSSLASCAADGRIKIWHVDSKRIALDFEAHHNAMALGVDWSPDGKSLISCSTDGAIAFWGAHNGQKLDEIWFHRDKVEKVIWSPCGNWFASCSWDRTIAIWYVGWDKPIAVLRGHSAAVYSLAWSPDSRVLCSAGWDSSIRIWDTKTYRTIAVLEGHKGKLCWLSFTSGGGLLASKAKDDTVRIWRCADWLEVARLREPSGHEGSVFPSIAFRPKKARQQLELATVNVRDHSVCIWSLHLQSFRRGISKTSQKYVNAKVLLVGDSGVGKSGLSNFLAHGIKVEDDKPLPSTDGAWATHWPLRHTRKKNGVEREIWLWGFAGQVDYRLVHQLFMDDTAAAVLVFNPQNENPFEGLGRWDRDLQKAARKPFAKLLAAGRVDRGGLVVSATSMDKFMVEGGFLRPLHMTSAKTGEGCDQLRKAIVQAIDWKCIPETTSPALYHRMKQEILSLRDNSLVLIRLAELKQRMEMTLRGENFELAELEAVVSLLAGPGMIQRLDFGGFILLRPEVLSRYAAAVVRKVRKYPQEMGCIREDELLAGELDYQDFERLPHEDEAVVLRTLLETFISRAWCLRQPCDSTAILTFPSYFRRERKEQPSHPSVLVTYRFDGPTDDIYATLVVQLHHTLAFESTDLWKSAADFKTQTGAALGFTLARESEGTARLEVYFEPNVDPNSRVLFLRYVHDHLTKLAQNVVRLRHYFCGNKKCKRFNQPFADQALIYEAGGEGKIFCPGCGRPIRLNDLIEEKFDSHAVKEQVREMQSKGQDSLDNESRELILVGHAFSIVAEAGQIYRGYTNSDHGIDGEIEFKDDQGRATGKRLYVQLKSGDSYLKKRQSDGAEVFQIKNPRWASYWQQQAYAVMLVIRSLEGEIRWMDVSAYLKRSCVGGKTMKQIVFEGERFDVMSVRRWRDRVLG